MREKVHRRRSVREGPLEKMAAEEGPIEKMAVEKEGSF